MKQKTLIENADTMRKFRESQPRVTLKEAQDQARRVMAAKTLPKTKFNICMPGSDKPRSV